MIICKKAAFIFFLCVFFSVPDNYANNSLTQKTFIVTPELQKKIKRSPFRLTIKGNNGKKFRVYLYAENESSEKWKETACSGGREYEIIAKIGRYYLYLYDINAHKFLPTRTAVFYDFNNLTMNTDGAKFFLWSSRGKNQNDIIFLSQYVACSVGNEYEAYGLSADQLYLEQYKFVDNEISSAFSGFIYLGESDINYVSSPNLYGYTTFDGRIVQYKFTLSDKPREIKQIPK